MKKLKIFVLRSPWRHQDFGGAEDLALTIVKSLNSLGMDAYVVSGAHEVINRAKAEGTAFIVGPFSNHQILTKHRFIFLPLYLLDLYRSYKEYLRIFKKNRPDIVHCTGQQDSIAATSAAKKLGIQVIWSDHGELKNSLGFKFMPPWGIPGYLLKRRIYYISALCMVNPEDIEIVRSRIKTPLNIVRIPNGVANQYKPRASSPKYDIVYASRVIREKGIFELLEAFSRIQNESNNHYSLLIAGDGPSLSSSKQLVANQNIQKVTFRNYSDESIQEGRIFVLPTYTEAQSLAILKAMMYETPIVTTNIEGNTHFLKHKVTAFLVNPQDSESLYAGIKSVLNDNILARKLAENAKNQYEHEHDLSTIVEKYYLKLYEDLLK